MGSAANRLTALFFALALMAGCASHPVSDEQARDIPRDRFQDTQFLEQKPGYGAVRVTRDSSSAAAGMCVTPFYIDGVRIVDFDTYDQVTFYLPPGKHIIGVRLDGGFCGRAFAEYEALVAADQLSRYRIGWGADGIVVIQPTAF